MKASERSAADEAFGEFVRSSEAHLKRVAVLMCGDAGLAQDLVQTAYLRTYARWSQVSDSPLPYARKIILNAQRDRWRRTRGREWIGDAPEAVTAAPDLSSSVASRDLVTRALGLLTVKERRVVVLRFLADLSEVDTAAELGIAVGTVKSTASRALAKLRANPHLSELNLEVQKS